MIRMVLRMALVGAVAWASTPGEARADPASAAPAADKKQVAKRYTDAGVAAKEAGDYDTAIAMYQKAYQLVPHPKLIFDIAQALRLAGRLDEALREYRRYVAAEPSGREADTAREFITEIEAKIGAKSDARTNGTDAQVDATLAGGAQPVHDASAGDVQRTGGSIPGGGDGAGTGSHVAGTTPSASAGEHPGGGAPASGAGGAASGSPDARDAGPGEASPGRTVRIVGLATGGAGLAALAVGIGYGVHASTLSSSVSKMYDQRKYEDGGQANQIAIAGFVSGGVLIATGAVLYWWGHAQDRVSEKTVVMPVISDHSAALALVGAWP